MPLTNRKANLPPPLVGFEHVNRFSLSDGTIVAKILPGEYYVTCEDEKIGTVLGSCVSACIRDRVFGIGGMNHFMLPETESGGQDDNNMVSEAMRYGSYAMEHLINDIMKHGGRRQNLEIKIFGGASLLDGKAQVGELNVAFVRRYLQMENLDIVAENTLGNTPRKLLYTPRTGKVKMKRLQKLNNNTIMSRETSYREQLVSSKVEGSVELFD